MVTREQLQRDQARRCPVPKRRKLLRRRERDGVLAANQQLEMTVFGGPADLKSQPGAISVSDILDVKAQRGGEGLYASCWLRRTGNCYKGKMGSRGVGRFTRLVGEPGARVRWTERGDMRKREPRKAGPTRV